MKQGRIRRRRQVHRSYRGRLNRAYFRANNWKRDEVPGAKPWTREKGGTSTLSYRDLTVLAYGGQLGDR